nr:MULTISPECIES: ABC transporter permease subunit [unclassified Rhizobium]
MPDFLVATILLFVFAVAVPVLPALANISENSSWQEMLRATVLPAVKLANMMAVYAIRVLRDSLIEVLRSDYVRLAELKGLGPAPRFSATRFPMPSCRR